MAKSGRARPRGRRRRVMRSGQGPADAERRVVHGEVLVRVHAELEDGDVLAGARDARVPEGQEVVGDARGPAARGRVRAARAHRRRSTALIGRRGSRPRMPATAPASDGGTTGAVAARDVAVARARVGHLLELQRPARAPGPRRCRAPRRLVRWGTRPVTVRPAAVSVATSWSSSAAGSPNRSPSSAGVYTCCRSRARPGRCSSASAPASPAGSGHAARGRPPAPRPGRPDRPPRVRRRRAAARAAGAGHRWRRTAGPRRA